VTVGAGQEVTADFALVPSTQRLDELVTVTPGGMQTQVKALPTPVTVITAKDIEQLKPRNTQQLIRQAVPTAISWDVAGNPAFTSFSARGATTLNGNGAMKVFVDGVEASDFLFAPVDPNSIERIEVIRGPQAAAVYGSDAIGGVVQIYTKRGDASRAGPLIQAQAEAGVIQTPYEGFGGVLRQDYSASIHGGTSNTSYNFGAGFSRNADYLPRDEISRQSAPSAYGGVQYSSGNFSADVFGRYFINKNPDVFNPLLAQTGYFFFTQPNFQPTETSNQTLGTRLTLTPMRGWQNILRVGLDRTTIDRVQTRPRLTTPDDTLLSVFNSEETKRSIAFSSLVQGAVSPGISGSVSIGLDHYSLPGTTFAAFSTANTSGVIDNAGLPAFLARVVINNTGYFAQGEVGFRDALFLTAGARAEDNSEFGDSLGTPISPRVGASLVQQLGATTLKLRGSYGRGIRAPTPGQKTANVNSFQVQLPNPILGPERQQGWDTGVDAIFGGKVSLSVTWYDQKATDLIEFVQLSATPVPTVQFQNVAQVKNMGLEVEAKWNFGRVQLNGQYGYTRSRIDELGPSYVGDLQVGDQALLTPKHTAGGGLTFALLPTTTVTGGITYVGSWKNYDGFALYSCFGGTGPCQPSNRDYIIAYPGFAKIHASISHSFTPTLTAFLSVENLTNNQAYENANTQTVFGRTTTLGLQYHQ
jgi:iron complex outermembrane receptor protein